MRLPNDFGHGMYLALLLVIPPLACADDGEEADEQGGATTTSTPADSTTGEGSQDETSMPPVSTGPSMPAAHGEPCTSPDDCMSGICYDAGFAGQFCGECQSDADCSEFGCSQPLNPLVPGITSGSTCGDGSAGSGCQSDDACQDDLRCVPATISLVPGNSCGECGTDADCPDGRLCSDVFTFEGFPSTTACVEPGSLPDATTCDHDGSGDDACENLCVETSLMFGTIGVCNICESDADCLDGQACIPPMLNMGSIVPGACL